MSGVALNWQSCSLTLTCLQDEHLLTAVIFSVSFPLALYLFSTALQVPKNRAS